MKCCRKLAVGVGVVLLSVWTCAAAERVLRIGAEEYPPFEYAQAGEPTGIDVDVLTAVFGKLGVPFRVEFYPFPRALRMLEEGQLDGYLSMSYHPKREDSYYFSEQQRRFPETFHVPDEYLWLTRYVFFANRSFLSSLEFRDYEQLRKAHHRVGVVRGYTYDGRLAAAGLELIPFSTQEDGFRALANRDIDLFPADQVVGHAQCRRLGLDDVLDHLDHTIVAKPYYLLFSRKSDYPELASLKDAFGRGLHALRASGDYDRILAGYPAEDTANIFRPVVFMCEEWPPFEYEDKDGIPAGLDATILASVMRRLQRPYNIRFYPWSRVLAMVRNGQADAVLSVSYKRSREDLFFYTDEQRQFPASGRLPADYLWVSQYVFFIKKKNEGRLKFDSYEQIAADGYRIGVNSDYSYNPEFRRADLQRLVYPTTEKAFAALIDEDIDLYPIDRTVGMDIIGRMGLRDSVTTLAKPLFSKPYLIPFCRSSSLPGVEQLMNSFNAELRAMRASGAYEDLRRKHDVWQPGTK